MDVDKAMASFVFSAAPFKARMDEMGFPQVVQERFVAKNWATVGDFAFCVPGQAGSVDPAVFEKEVSEPLRGEDRAMASRVRWFHAQSYAVVATDLDRLVNADPDTAV